MEITSVSEKRKVDLEKIRSVEKNGVGLGTVTVTWSNGDKESFFGQEGANIWEFWK